MCCSCKRKEWRTWLKEGVLNTFRYHKVTKKNNPFLMEKLDLSWTKTLIYIKTILIAASGAMRQIGITIMRINNPEFLIFPIRLARLTPKKTSSVIQREETKKLTPWGLMEKEGCRHLSQMMTTHIKTKRRKRSLIKRTRRRDCKKNKILVILPISTMKDIVMGRKMDGKLLQYQRLLTTIFKILIILF